MRGINAMSVSRPQNANARTDIGESPAKTFDPHFLTVPSAALTRNELPFRLGDAHPELRRLLHLHIPKTGGTSLDSILCRNGETLPAPINPFDACYALSLIEPSRVQGPDKQDPQSLYLQTAKGLLRSGKLRWILPVQHLRLAEIISMARDDRDVCFTLLRDPWEQVKSMLRYRIYQTLIPPGAENHLPMHQLIGISHSEFVQGARSSDPNLFRSILRIESEQYRHLGFSPWLCLPGQQNTCAQMLASIATHCIHCATAPTMASMVQSLTGLTCLSSTPVHNNRADDLNHSGLRLHIDDAVITPYVEESAVELFRRLQEAGALEVWDEPSTAAEEYWRCIDRALKAQARSSSAHHPLAKATTPLPSSPAIARLHLLQELTAKAELLGEVRRERDDLLRSRSWRATAPYRRFRRLLARLRRRLGRD